MRSLGVKQKSSDVTRDLDVTSRAFSNYDAARVLYVVPLGTGGRPLSARRVEF